MLLSSPTLTSHALCVGVTKWVHISVLITAGEEFEEQNPGAQSPASRLRTMRQRKRKNLAAQRYMLQSAEEHAEYMRITEAMNGRQEKEFEILRNDQWDMHCEKANM